MDPAEEKFFENLAKGGPMELGAEQPEEGSEPQVELAKANISVPKEKSPKRNNKTERTETETEGQLTIDVYQTPEEIVVESPIAGVKPEDIDIDVTPDSVSIRGERYREGEISDQDYFYQECYWGRFSRSVILPQEIDPESASVNFKNGVLSVRLPKVNRQKTRKLKVRFE